MKRVAFISSGCQNNFGRPREIIASLPDFIEVTPQANPDYLMVNFCAISAEKFADFENLKRDIMNLKRFNPKLKILAGGCIEGLNAKKDLSFADAIYHHQEEAEAFLRLIGCEPTVSHPSTMFGAAQIVIAQGCNRHCTFCKVHYLNYMHLTSRPLSEIIALVHGAVEQGINHIQLTAENSSEYGHDIGTNICNLLQAIFAIEGVQRIDIFGLCLDEIDSELLALLQNPKVCQLQLELQSLDNSVRKAMGLSKTYEEALAIFDALRDKAIISNFITGFVNSNIEEFDAELQLIQDHHLYFLTLSPYDDTEGTPSHQMYEKPLARELTYYQTSFIETVAAERRQLLKQLVGGEPITATIVEAGHHGQFLLTPDNYCMKIVTRRTKRPRKVGDVVKVKITGLHSEMPKQAQALFISQFQRTHRGASSEQIREFLRNYQYFGGLDQIMMVEGVIENS